MRRISPRARLLIAVFAVLGLLMAGLTTVPLLMVMGSTAVSADTSTGSLANCGPVTTAGGRTITLADDQLANAKTVIQTGQTLKVPNRGLVVAIATALQESTLKNLGWGDLDSVGLFQQRNGWGSFDERTDPATSATMFYTGGRGGQPGLMDIPDWPSMSIARAAQAVQRSRFPFAYAKWEPLAASLVGRMIGNDPLGCTDVIGGDLPSGAVGKMLEAALAQQGDPYEWGAVGPDSFDCSGLVIYSWGQAGYRVQVRTAAQMSDNSTTVEPGSEQPGDLLFGEYDHAGNAHHVMIVIRAGLAVQAPSTGRNVQVSHYTADGTRWRLGRLHSSILKPVAVPA